jgi:uncharacterized membrane protein YozB (DUF420 family)
MATTTGTPPTNHPATAPRRKWWQRPWVVPLTLVALMFLTFSIPPYATLDPELSRIKPPASFPLYYPALVGHVMFASVAMLTCCLQVWPWFRQRFPAAHRRIGRIYVFAGALPAGVCGLVLAVVTPFGPVVAASSIVLATLWLTCTVTGFRMARQRRFADHRRWMIRSFALTFSIVTNRIWGIILAIAFGMTPDQFSDPTAAQTLAGMATWLGWTLPLLVAEWWLVERRRPRRQRVPS